LNDGTQIPQLGFGVYKVAAADTASVVSEALDAGYRHVDTAAAYDNETPVGEAVRSATSDVYVTTKYFNPADTHGFSDAKAAFERSADRLGLDHIDLYLIHVPVSAGEGFTASWRAFVELRDSTRLRSIGVSNFTDKHLTRVIDDSGVVPAINQVELHPYFQQKELRRFHDENGIVTEAWGPLGQGAVLEDPVLRRIADRHGKSVGQVVIRWHLQLGTVVIPKSVTTSRIRDNIDVFDFDLNADDMADIADLDRPDGNNGPDFHTFEFSQNAPGGGR
jgi:2,5-diketo-D-gluconate reductase A